jgi:hypothetical protein
MEPFRVSFVIVASSLPSLSVRTERCTRQSEPRCKPRATARRTGFCTDLALRSTGHYRESSSRAQKKRKKPAAARQEPSAAPPSALPRRGAVATWRLSRLRPRVSGKSSSITVISPKAEATFLRVVHHLSAPKTGGFLMLQIFGALCGGRAMRRRYGRAPLQKVDL